MGKEKCAVNNEWCRGSMVGGYCVRHYERSKTNKPLDAPFPTSRHSGETPKCKHASEDCNRYYAKNMCKFHYHREYTGKDPATPKESTHRNKGLPCDHTNCDREAVSGGYCHTHSMQMYTAGETWDINSRKRGHPRGTCRITGCKDPVHRHQRCRRHWTEHRDRTLPEYKNKALCAVPFCEHPARVRTESRICTFHGKRANAFSITEDEMLELLGDGKCALCDSTYRLAIDHDHNCCPGNSGCCGKCIRGVLCANCNMALGNFEDRSDVLLKAVQYLRAKPKTF